MKDKKETRYMIILAFESKADQKEVLSQLRKKKTITWSNDSKQSTLTRSKMGACFVNVSKSKMYVPTPIQL